VVEGAKERDRRTVGRISRRPAAWLAWSVAAICVVVMVLTLPVIMLTPSGSQGGNSLLLFALFAVFSVSLPTVGALIVSRHPRNAIGWLFCGTGLIAVIGVFADAYSDYAVAVHGGSLVGAKALAWFASWGGDPTPMLSLALLFLLFPNGTLPSRRWRPVLWAVIVGSALFYVSGAVDPGPLLTQKSLVNPIGIKGALGAVFGLLGTIGLILLLIACLASAVSLIFRLRRGSAQERQQLKWVAYPAATSAFGFVVSYVASNVFGSHLGNAVGYWIGITAFLTLPVFTAFAVLKYRLYDIDNIINRTLVYGTLTGTLALLYFGGVTLTQALFRTLTGQQELPQLVVVASTLVIAALFNPLRRRIQFFIDRQFYRSKYDARKTLESFSVKLRDETDLEALNEDLVGAVRETMQPAHVSLWLRPEGASKDVPRRVMS
jgi:hypothetical protein